MAYDKLVDSAQLDADLLSVANAIRAKGGTSAALAFPADFVQAIGDIQTGGGGNIQTESGTFTLAADSRTHSISVSFEPQHVIFYSDKNEFTENSWKTFALALIDPVSDIAVRLVGRYINDALSTLAALIDTSNFSYSGGTLSIDTGSNSYKMQAATTYKWFAWRETAS